MSPPREAPPGTHRNEPDLPRGGPIAIGVQGVEALVRAALLGQEGRLGAVLGDARGTDGLRWARHDFLESLGGGRFPKGTGKLRVT